jgi:glutaminyl-peptide cyclotransferase
MTIRKSQLIFLVALGIISVFIALLIWRFLKPPIHTSNFDGQRAYQDVVAQVAFGPRIPDSKAHTKTVAYIQDELQKAGWNTKLQNISWNGYTVLNIIASRSKQTPQIILGAHYDSRSIADQDTEPAINLAVPGANDGASGVAILLELARTLPNNSSACWLVFFDAEDDGGVDGREWIMGSRAFVDDLSFRPKAAVIVDMVGDSDLNIYIEKNSTSALVSEIWRQAAKLGYGRFFIQTPKYSMIDDHTPFLEAGIPAIDIIDFDYPYWHTTEDTPDKVSAESLHIVGETLLEWMNNQDK